MGVFLCKIFERGGQNVCCCNQRKRKSRRTDVKRYISYPKRDPIQNYFPLPNEIYILGLTAGEIAVYGYLFYCENRKTYQCYPSYKTIGRAISMSKNTVSKYVRILEDKGFIWTEQTSIITKDGIKRNGNLLYTIRPIQEVLDRFYATQFAQMELEQKRADLQPRLSLL